MTKKVYYIDCDCSCSCGQSLVNLLNEKYSIGFTSSKEARKYLSTARKLIKTRFAEELKKISNHCVITIDLYKGEVNDDFDLDKDCFFEEAFDNYNCIEIRYLKGRY